MQVKANFQPSHLAGFIHLYQQAYSEPPYNETYSDEDVLKDVWNPHLENGCIILALHEGKVIGLGCCMQTNLWIHDKEFQDFIHQEAARLPDAIRNLCFMSEVCVNSAFRRQGIGTRLIQDRIAWARSKHFSHYIMRTAAVGSNSRDMYLKLNAWEIVNLIQDVSHHAEEFGGASNFRIFMTGKVE